MTNQPTPATKPLDEQIEQLLDSHAEYYIKETMQFFKNDGISPALSKNNKGDLTTKTAIKALITNAEKQARITPTHIMGKTIDEVCGILTMLDMERLAEMQLTMANLHKWYKLLAEEQKAMLEKNIADRIKELENL